MDALRQDLEIVDSLPHRAKDFISALDQQFVDTIAQARHRAMLLRQVADEIDLDADELEKGLKTVPNLVERWIRFERSASDRLQSLGLVNPVRNQP